MSKKIMSVAIPQEMQDLIGESSKKMGWNKSELIRKLIAKHLDLIVNDGEEIPVILKIPSGLKGNHDELQKWLYTRIDAIVKALAPEG